jgi:argininosuccinate lyase
MKPWGGRFKDKTDTLMERFSASIELDRRLYEYDIEGSKAHADLLERIGFLSKDEAQTIIYALDEIKEEISSGIFLFSDSLEDIHMHIEARLIEKIGDTGKKLHTGRSRNDQVALDMRLYLRDEARAIDDALLQLLTVILKRAEDEKDTLMPGYTHMQRAQVVPFGHYLMAYYYMFKRDRERLKPLTKGLDVMPLGAGAIAGSTLPLDRDFIRERLGFREVSQNIMDAVSDRDFVIDMVFCVAMVMLHLSRLSEDLIIFSTEEFSFIALPDMVCTGSSLMPHKKNPDALELIRGKAASVISDLFTLFLIMKGLPMTYNRDMQEDKRPLFHSVDTLKDSLGVITLCITGMSINRERLSHVGYQGFISATEMAEYLTKKGMAFREAHHLIGRVVRECEEKGISFRDLGLEELKRYSPLFDEGVFDSIDPYHILENRKVEGAGSIDEVERALERERLYINS